MQQHDLVHIPQPRREPPLEELVSCIADLVLKANDLADRYELGLLHLTESRDVEQQQVRVLGLRSAVARGRDRLIEIGQRR
jgi:hypothetical protein